MDIGYINNCVTENKLCCNQEDARSQKRSEKHVYAAIETNDNFKRKHVTCKTCHNKHRDARYKHAIVYDIEYIG